MCEAIITTVVSFLLEGRRKELNACNFDLLLQDFTRAPLYYNVGDLFQNIELLGGRSVNLV